MIPCRDWFCTYELVSEDSMFIGDDHALEIVGIGIVKIKMFDSSIHTMQGMRQVKGLKKNLLSIVQLDIVGVKLILKVES